MPARMAATIADRDEPQLTCTANALHTVTNASSKCVHRCASCCTSRTTRVIAGRHSLARLVLSCARERWALDEQTVACAPFACHKPPVVWCSIQNVVVIERNGERM